MPPRRKPKRGNLKKRAAAVRKKIAKAPAAAPKKAPAHVRARKPKKAKRKKKKGGSRAGAKSRFSKAARERASGSPLAGMKKPPNAYFIFTKEHRPLVMERLGLSNSPQDWKELAQELGRMYRELEPEEKASYERRAVEGKKRDAFLRKVIVMGMNVPPEQVPELMTEIQQESAGWGSGLDRWNTMAIFLVLVTRSPVRTRRAFVGNGGLPIAAQLLTAAAAGLAEDADTEIAPDAAPDMVLTALALLQGLPVTRDQLRATGGLALGAKRLRDLLRTGIPDKVTEQMLKTALQEVIDVWARVQRGEPAVVEEPEPPPPAPAQRRSSGGERLVGEKRKRLSDSLICNASDDAAAPRGKHRAVSATPPPAPNFTGNLREKVVEKFAACFELSEAAVARRIENALYLAHGATIEYKQGARTLAFNLGHDGNADLRQRLLSGELPVASLVTMDARELAPPEIREARAKAEADGFNAVVDRSGGGVMVWDKYTGTMKMRSLQPEQELRGFVRRAPVLDSLLTRLTQKVQPADEE